MKFFGQRATRAWLPKLGLLIALFGLGCGLGSLISAAFVDAATWVWVPDCVSISLNGIGAAYWTRRVLSEAKAR